MISSEFAARDFLFAIMVNISPDKWIMIAFEHRPRPLTIIKAVSPKKRRDLPRILNARVKISDQDLPVDYRLKELAMRRSSAFSIIALCAIVAASQAEAKLDLYIDKSTQQISVVRNGALLYLWPVSTGRDRFSTPSGVYAPERLEPIWYSKAYYNAPMPHAIFFHQGYAIHGSYDIARLGGPASHGCVRLHPQDAALLYAMVEQEGPGNTTIVVGGGSPNPLPPRYRDVEEPPRPPYLRDSATPRGAYPPDARMPPHYDASQDPYQYVDGPGRRRGDNNRLAMREAYPPNRPPAPLDAEAPFEPTPHLHGSYRPPLPRVDAEAPIEPALPPRASYRPPAPRRDAEAPFEPAPSLRGGYRLPAPRLDAEAPIESTLPPRGSYRLPVPRREAETPIDPALGPRGSYRLPVARREAEAPFEPALLPRGSYRLPAPRLDAEAPIEPALPPRGSYRLPAPRREAEAPIEPALGPRGSYRLPATTRPNSKCPTCSLNRASDEQPNRNVSANRKAKSLPPSLPSPSAPPASSLPPSEPSASSSPPSAPPASPQPSSASSASSTPATPQSSEQPLPSSGYKVLPRSYWAGASWRWRLKAEHEISVPALTSDSP
jgi:L,D-transpeptidase-like protein